ncbi:hypothetical protein TNCT_348351 [Trichonephila clavata]|uniref:Uncharacterized protein n=1 Tax=Trichonephila clavata TaxID=2740835 RepID=A0A8X6GV98_TRICU|nr:hypothetical protein TNCT_348351 [Trichonephila clavata]
MNHFVTWIRDIITGYWLECDDLNSDVSSFTISQPTISLEDVSIFAYEAIDNDGTIFLKDDLGDVTVDNNDYILIDLEDESKDDANNKIDKTDADKLKQCSSRSGKKNCNKSENISADYVNNKTSQFTDLNDAKESTSSLENEENIIKGDILQKRDSLASIDSFLEFVDRENNEISLKVIDYLLKCIEKNVEEANPTPLLDSLTCQSSNIVSKNNVEYSALKESLKENMDDIFKTGSKNCSVEKKIFPLNVSENVTGETVHKKADDTCFLQNEPLCETTEIQVKKSDLISQREIKIGFEVQQVPENSAREFTDEIKPITKHSKPISSTQEHTICMGNTENSKNKKYFYTTRSKRKKSIDNSALETIPQSGNTASKPPKNFSRRTNPIMHTIKTAHNSSTPNAIKQKKTSVEDKIMPCAKYALKEVSVVIKMLKESELSKYMSSDHKDVNKLNSNYSTEKKQGAVASASLTIDRNSVRNEDIPIIPVTRKSIKELRKTIAVKSKIHPDSHSKNGTLQNSPSQQSNPSIVFCNVSALDKTNDKSAVKNLVKNQSEPIRRSSRIGAHRPKSEKATYNKGKCIKKFKLKQNEKLADALVHNAQTKSITKGEIKFSPEPNETEHNIESDGLQTKTSKTMSMDVCKNSDSSLKVTSKIEEETLKKEILKKSSEQTVTKFINESKLKQNEELTDAIVNNAQTKGITKGENKFSPGPNETEHSIKSNGLQTKTSETMSMDACKNSDSSLKRTSKIEETLKEEIPERSSEQTVTTFINEIKLKQNEKLADAIVNNAQIKGITNGENKFSPEPNETKHNIKSDGLQTKTSKTMSMDACKNSDSSLKRTSKIEEETLKNEIPKKIPEQTRSTCNSNLDALTENLKGENVKPDFANTKRKRLRKTNTYESITLNWDFVSSSNQKLVRRKTIKTNKLNGKQTNAINLNEFSELFGTLPDNLSFLSESDKKKQNPSYPINNKRCKISENTDNYNSVSEKTYNKRNVSNKVGMSNDNLCKVSSSKSLKKTSIPRLKTISGNISKKICPRFDMLTLCKQKRKAECLIPAQTKRDNKNLDVDLHSALLQFLVKNKMVPKEDTISNLTICLKSYDDLTVSKFSVPSANSAMEINSDQTNGSLTVFPPSVNRNHDKISLITSNVDKSLKSLPNSTLLDSVRTNSTEHSQKQYNSNAANLKNEMHPNNSAMDIHSVQAQTSHK